MDDDPKEKPSSKGERLRKEKVAPRKGGYFFAQKFFQHKPTQTNVYNSVWVQERIAPNNHAQASKKFNTNQTIPYGYNYEKAHLSLVI